MARSRSFFAASNKGKAGQVLLNNMVAAGQRQAKQRKKDRDAAKRREAKENDRALKRAMKEREAAEKRAEKERARQAREQEKIRQAEEKEKQRLLKEKAKADKKFEGLVNRAKLLCGKNNIGISMAEEIAQIAFDAEVTPAAIEKNIILPSLRKYQVRGIMEPLREEIIDDFLDNLIDDFVVSEVPVDEILGSSEVKEGKAHKILIDYLRDSLSADEILVTDFHEAVGASWPPIALDDFIVKCNLQEKKSRKKRDDMLTAAVEAGKIREESREALFESLNNNVVDPDAILGSSEYLAAEAEKVGFDKTSEVLKTIYERKALSYEGYIELEEYAYEKLIGQDLEELQRSEIYQRLEQKKKGDLEKIFAIESDWMPETIEKGSVVPVIDPTLDHEKPYSENMIYSEFQKYSKFRRGQLYRLLVWGLIGRHRFYADRLISGSLMLLAFCYLVWHWGPNVGETGTFLAEGEIHSGSSQGPAFDLVYPIKSNANLRAGPSTNAQIIKTLQVDDGHSYQVLRQASDENWYEIREIRSIFSVLNPSQEDMNFLGRGIQNTLDYLGDSSPDLVVGYVHKGLLKFSPDPDSPQALDAVFSSLEVFLALLALWFLDVLLFFSKSRLLKPTKSKGKILI